MKVVGKYDDAQLVEALRDAKQRNEAILYLYKQYAETISSFIKYNGGSEQDADDVFQEAVVAFVDMVIQGKFRQESAIKTFLVSIAKNIWFNQLKKRNRSDAREMKYETGREQEEADISHFITEREKKQQLRELLFKLGDPCKKLLILFYYENMPMKEISKHLPYENEQVVRNKKYKCLQQLAGMIKENAALARLINENL